MLDCPHPKCPCKIPANVLAHKQRTEGPVFCYVCKNEGRNTKFHVYTSTKEEGAKSGPKNNRPEAKPNEAAKDAAHKAEIAKLTKQLEEARKGDEVKRPEELSEEDRERVKVLNKDNAEFNGMSECLKAKFPEYKDRIAENDKERRDIYAKYRGMLPIEEQVAKQKTWIEQCNNKSEAVRIRKEEIFQEWIEASDKLAESDKVLAEGENKLAELSRQMANMERTTEGVQGTIPSEKSAEISEFAKPEYEAARKTLTEMAKGNVKGIENSSAIQNMLASFIKQVDAEQVNIEKQQTANKESDDSAMDVEEAKDEDIDKAWQEYKRTTIKDSGGKTTESELEERKDRWIEIHNKGKKQRTC
jgi:hypothetical protein